MDLVTLRLKKNEDRRIRAGHVWIYSNEVDTSTTPLKTLQPGQEVEVVASDKTVLGIAYVNPHSLILARLISRNPKDRLDRDFLITRLAKANQWREDFFPTPNYRLAFGDSDGLAGLVVDRFGLHLVVQIGTAGMETKKEEIVAALCHVLPETLSILFRNDSSARQQEGLPSYVSAGFGTPPERVLLEENGTQFYAPLWSGQKTGWFFDHRLNRARLNDYVSGKRVLDVFSYLGGWGIQAAHNGATDVLCLDASAQAINAIPENAALNGVGEKVEVMCEDAFVGLKKLAQVNNTFDVIIVDPPAFVKKLRDKKEGLLAYQRINEAAFKLLNPGGVLLSCSCSMHVDYAEFVQVLRRASYKAHCDIQIMERGHQAPDHPVHVAIPETDYLKMIIVRRGI